MKFLVGLVVFTLIAVLAWPYLYVWRPDARSRHATRRPWGGWLTWSQCVSRLEPTLLETSTTRSVVTVDRLSAGLNKAFRRSPIAPSTRTLTRLGTTTLRRNLGNLPKNAASLMGDMSYAFYESHDTFLVRLGELGSNPMHLRLRLQNNEWRVVEIFVE